MKKCWIMLALALLLPGCGTQETMETVSDVYDAPVMAQVQQVELTLPEGAAVPSMENPEAGRIYLCDGYTLTVQTGEAGDLDKTLRQVTGYKKEQLTLMETQRGGVTRYECAWSAAGEGGDQVCRAVILDDGSYHYAVTAMTDSAKAGELTAVWQGILDSVRLVSTG